MLFSHLAVPADNTSFEITHPKPLTNQFPGRGTTPHSAAAIDRNRTIFIEPSGLIKEIRAIDVDIHSSRDMPFGILC